MQDGAVCPEVPDGDALLEHVPVLPYQAQPEHEQVVFRDVVPQDRTEGLVEAVEELSEAGDVFGSGVALDEVCMSEGPLCLPAGDGDLAIPGSHLCSWRRCHL